MDCPTCGAETAVRHTDTQPTLITRRRRCTGPEAHRFTSVEVPQASPGGLAVRRSTTGRVTGPFSPQKLHDDLRAAILLKSEQVGAVATATEIVDAAVATISATQHWHTALTAEDRATAGASVRGLHSAVLDRHIVEAVDAELERRGLDSLRVLYSLATRRVQGKQLAKWRDATEVLSWLGATFPSARRPIPPRREADRIYAWAVPESVEPPRTVVKRGGRSAERFNLSKLNASISLTFQGRQQKAERLDEIALFVLAGLQGQRLVHSNQLSASILSTLRRIDEIAYLRCAIALKGPLSAAAIADEAEDLITDPSPSLRFETRIRAEVTSDHPIQRGVRARARAVPTPTGGPNDALRQMQDDLQEIKATLAMRP